MKVKVGVVQDYPVFFDREKTLDKMESILADHAEDGYQLLVFPESFIPGYPRGFTFGAAVGKRTEAGKSLYAEYRSQSVDINGPDLKRLERLSKTYNTYLVVGITERSDNHGSLFCSMLYVSPDEGLLGVHRKIKPTGTERVIWSEASGEDLVTFNTNIGKLGGLICWENYMPLARMAMYQKGIEIYIAPTADARESWVASMRHIALEGRCFVLGCNQYISRSMIPEKYQDMLTEEEEQMCPGGSVIVSPSGEVLAGPLWNAAGIVSAVIDLEDIPRQKLDFDVNGHYSRKDIFEFRVKNQPEIHNEKNKRNEE
ncbi:carbon-nitrogen hydrolase family protein [Muriicola soli]|uniref:Carbon-nitrogen hydrolase family protein n=1 Tax=Muriicola soli TaxID=2507538 RepID=A0A411E6R1_9FLAO|nr:carbon-nitrogen hydrolase family protein [Muriicola soli]QBA63180.1 carbon-nitrogen hydrolase family protein [Muriicola soli]